MQFLCLQCLSEINKKSQLHLITLQLRRKQSNLRACKLVFVVLPFLAANITFYCHLTKKWDSQNLMVLQIVPKEGRLFFGPNLNVSLQYIIFDIFRCFKTLLMGCGGKYPPVFSRLANMVIPLFCDQRTSWDMGALCHMMIDVLSCSVCASRFDAT